MRLDHIAYRVRYKWRTAKFFIECFNYRIPEDLPDGFEIEFEDGSKSLSLVLLPPEILPTESPWIHYHPIAKIGKTQEFHLPPEIFVSEGTPGSAVGEWVESRGGIGGIHHLAYQVDSVKQKMREWKEKGYGEFTTKEPLSCEGLIQVFTKPSLLTGVIYEFIERGQQGFCKNNVKDLMNSTRNYSKVL